MSSEANFGIDLHAARDELENLKVDMAGRTVRKSPRNLPSSGVAKLAEKRRALGEVVNAIVRDTVADVKPTVESKPKVAWGAVKSEKSMGKALFKEKKIARVLIFDDTVGEEKSKIEKISSDPLVLGQWLEANQEQKNKEEEVVERMVPDSFSKVTQYGVDATCVNLGVEFEKLEENTEKTDLRSNLFDNNTEHYPEVESMSLPPSSDLEDYFNAELDDELFYIPEDDIAGIEAFVAAEFFDDLHLGSDSSFLEEEDLEATVPDCTAQ